MVRGILAFLIGFFFMAGVISTSEFISKAYPHDSWISEGGLKNSMGQYCCGPNDCGEMVDGAVTPVPGGYEVNGDLIIDETKQHFYIHEFVPNSESQPSLNGRYVMCRVCIDKAGCGEKFFTDLGIDYAKVTAGVRRCFFFPPTNT
jgi:hypothetical protein